MAVNPRVDPRKLEAAIVVALMFVAAYVRFSVAQTWVFAGSDSYGYNNLAETLWNHGRYALSAKDPPHFGRMPLYAMFLAVMKRNHPAGMMGGDGWDWIRNSQVTFDLLTLPIFYFAMRKIAGVKAALITLGLIAICPFMPLYDSTALSESIATSLTTLTISALLLGLDRPRIGFAVAGALVGLSLLARPDGLLLFSAFVPATLALTVPRREKLIALGLAAAAFVVIYAPWPIRNQIAVGKPYFLGWRVDRYTRPLPRYEGWWRWVRSWCPDESGQTFLSTCFYNPPCVHQAFPPDAYDGPDERAEVNRLFQLRSKEGYSQAVDDGFDALGKQRERAGLFRYHVKLPLLRAYHMWISRFDELLPNRQRLPMFMQIMTRGFLPMFVILTIAILAATAVIATSRRRRMVGLILAVPIFVRTFALCYANYSMPRYTIELIALAIALCVLAGLDAYHRIRARRA